MIDKYFDESNQKDKSEFFKVAKAKRAQDIQSLFVSGVVDPRKPKDVNLSKTLLKPVNKPRTSVKKNEMNEMKYGVMTPDQFIKTFTLKG